MSKKTLWFGTEEYQEWVKCPDQGLQMNSTGRSVNGSFDNGGAWSDRSATLHRNYSATFSGDISEVSQILDFEAGVFGPGPFYLVDPFSQRTNILTKWISAPRLMAQDAPSFTKSTRPTLVTTGANGLRLPTRGAVFTLPDAKGVRSFRFPIPSGYTAYIKWWGSQTGTAVLTCNATEVDPDTVYTKTGPWLDITLGGTGTITIYGMVVQLRPTTGPDTPDFHVFYPGMGTTALDITGTQLTGYSAIRGRVSATVDMLEVGGWL